VKFLLDTPSLCHTVAKTNKFCHLLTLTKINPFNYENINKTGNFFDVLLTVHLSIFISVFNQLDAQNLFYNKFYFMTLHVSSA
jgi:hypothetical protein